MSCSATCSTPSRTPSFPSAIQRYLEIERARFADRVRVEIDLPDELESALVPSLLLQPLAENAVRHGIAPREGPGRIEITAHRDDMRLVLMVSDDGVGPGGDVSGANGVGLANTRERLAELYGEGHRFAIRGREGGGTEVLVEIPWRTRVAAGGPHFEGVSFEPLR